MNFSRSVPLAKRRLLENGDAEEQPRESKACWHIARALVLVFIVVATATTLGLVIYVAANTRQQQQQQQQPPAAPTPIATTPQEASVLGGSRRGPSSPPPLPPPPPPPMLPTLDADVIIIGTGVGGLYAGYHLAPKFQSGLLMLDNRARVGGVVQAIRYTRSNSTHPIWTPTHAEQLRSRDTYLRCLAQELGVPMVRRHTVGGRTEVYIRGFNSTSKLCYAPNEIPLAGFSPTNPLCAAGLPWEGVAPNGWIGNTTAVFPGLEDVCNGLSWRECSFEEKLWEKASLSKNVNSIRLEESLTDYLARVLGPVGRDYLLQVSATEFFSGHSARFHMREYRPFQNAGTGLFQTEPHGGPQVGILSRMARHIEGNQSRIQLNTEVTHIDYNTDPATPEYRYLLTATSGQQFRAKRVIPAIDAVQMRTLQGTVGSMLAGSAVIQGTGTLESCTWSAFFPSKPWLPSRQVCDFGYCTGGARNFTFVQDTRKYATWQFWDTPSAHPDSLSFGMYLPVLPERLEAGLLRFTFDAPGSCTTLNNLFKTGGNAAVTTEIMRRMRLRFGATFGQPIPNPAEAYFVYEPTGYDSFIVPGSRVTAGEVTRWAQEPIPGESICAAAASFFVADAGWMESGVRSAVSCLSGPVFADVFDAGQLQAFSGCRANITSNTANRELRYNNKNTYDDLCMLMRNEYNPRDWMNISNPALGLVGSFCGGPKSYVWPTEAELDPSGVYSVNQSLWDGATSTFQGPDEETGRRRFRHPRML